MVDVAHQPVQSFAASSGPFRDLSGATADWPQQFEAHEAGAAKRLHDDLRGIEREIAGLLEVFRLEQVVVHARSGDRPEGLWLNFGQVATDFNTLSEKTQTRCI